MVIRILDLKCGNQQKKCEMSIRQRVLTHIGCCSLYSLTTYTRRSKSALDNHDLGYNFRKMLLYLIF